MRSMLRSVCNSGSRFVLRFALRSASKSVLRCVSRSDAGCSQIF